MKKEKLMHWDVKFSIGIRRIDLEHKIFLDLINTLIFEVNENCEKQVILNLIIELEKYAEFHFISEENFMKRINYTSLDHHKNLHYDLLEKLNIEKHKKTLDDNFIDFVKDWFSTHTTIEDKKIYTFCMENNIQMDYKYESLNE